MLHHLDASTHIPTEIGVLQLVGGTVIDNRLEIIFFQIVGKLWTRTTINSEIASEGDFVVYVDRNIQELHIVFILVVFTVDGSHHFRSFAVVDGCYIEAEARQQR